MSSPIPQKNLHITAIAIACTVLCGHASAQSSTPTTAISDVDCFLNWAEVQLPTMLRPAQPPTQTAFNIKYRAYTGEVYAGVDTSTNSILALGGGFGPTVINYGPLTNYLPIARASNCGAPTSNSSGATLDWLEFTDANNWYFRAFVSNTSEGTPDSNGLTRYREIRSQNSGGSTVSWAFNRDYDRRNDLHFNGTTWVNCPLGFQNTQTERDAQGRSTFNYCDAYQRGTSDRTEVDIAGRTLSDVVGEIRRYPYSYGNTPFSQWGNSTSDGADRMQLGNAVFPTGSKLLYQAQSTTESSVGYDVRTSNEIFTYSSAVAAGGDARTSNTQVCNSAEAQTTPTIQVTTLDQLVQNYKGTPCVFSQGTLTIGGITYRSDNPNEWWGNSTLSIGTIGSASIANPGAYYTSNSLIRVGFGTGNAVTFYSCKQRAVNGSPRNCSAIGTGTYSVENLGDSRILKFSAAPSQANALTYDRVFVERGGKVYWGYKDKIIPYQRVRLNLEATNALFQQLGIPQITP